MQKANSAPIFSIVMVVFNRVSSVEKSILSVINQNFADFEFVVIDGGSTDGTLEILKKYGDKITRLISEKDNGIYDAMNKGVNASKGKLMYFLGSDDVLYDNSVLTDVAKFYTEKKPKIICGDVTYVGKDMKIRRRGGYMGMGNIRFGKMASHQAIFMDRELMQREGLFDDKRYTIVADYDLLCRLYLKKIKFAYFKRYIAVFGNQGHTLFSRQVLKKEKESVIRERFGSFFGNLFAIRTKILKLLGKL